MINREILEAQLGLYQKAQQHHAQALEQAKANFAAAGGAIEACQSFLKLLGEIEEAQTAKKSPESSGAEVVEVEAKK